MVTQSEIENNLKVAIENNRTDIVRSILSTFEHGELAESGHDILQRALDNQCCPDGTLLHLATKLSQPDIVRTLLASRADPGVQNTEGYTSLDLVTSHVVRDIYHQDLLQATAQSNIGRVSKLLSAGLDVNLVDSKETGNTPLHWAVSFGNADIVQFLCARGGDVNAYNSAGCTPLHDAVRRGYLPIIEELLMCGADPLVKVQCGADVGRDVFNMAVGKDDVLDLLYNPPEIVQQMDIISDNKQTGGIQYDQSCSILSNDSATPCDSPEKLLHPSNGSNEPLSPDNIQHQLHGMDVLSLTSPRSVITLDTLALLWPQPQILTQKDAPPFHVPKCLHIYIVKGPTPITSSIMNLILLRKPLFAELGVELSPSIRTLSSRMETPHVLCHVNPRLTSGDGSYKINLTATQIRILCHDVAALSYALSLLAQFCKLNKNDQGIQLPALQVDDWPEFQMRGVLLDISHGRLLNTDLMKNFLDKMSLLRINQVHMFSRFHCPEGEEDWQLAMSKQALLELDEFCHSRCVHLIPVLEVAPKVHFDDLAEIQPVLEEYCSCFPRAEYVNIGPRLSSFILEVTDDGRLSVQQSMKLLPVTSDQTLLICGYPLHDLSTSLLEHLPPHVIFMHYGVQADHDFKKFSQTLCNSGLSFCCCPGTAAWNSLAGCPEASLSNVYSAVRCSADLGANGLLVCDWSGKGHLTPHYMCWPGVLIGAGLAWNSDNHWDYLHTHVSSLLSTHIFHDPSGIISRTLIELGRIETFILRFSRKQAGSDLSQLPDEQGSLLFRLITQPDDVLLENISIPIIQKAVRLMKRVQADLRSVETDHENDHVIKELKLTIDLMLWASRLLRSLAQVGQKPEGQAGYAIVNLGVTNLPATARTDLANKLLEIVKVYKELWECCYEVQGREESLAVLYSLCNKLVPDSTLSLEHNDSPAS